MHTSCKIKQRHIMLFYKTVVINDNIISDGALTLSKALLHNWRRSGPSIKINAFGFATQ
jgi:disulfide oxidoreductase YuzD